MFQQDWLMRQIQMLSQFVAKLIFKKDAIKYEITNELNLTRTDLLYGALRELLLKSEICEAENLLFDNYEDSEEYLKLAVDFYDSLNKMDDAELEAGNFSREEIREGLSELLRRYGITFPDV